MQMDIVEHVKKYCQENGLIAGGCKILLAVSGGPDSIGLLHIFLKIRQSLDIELSIAHFNHGLRGDESDADQAFVERIAKKCGLPCYTEKALALIAERGESPEETARRFRYSFLNKIVQKIEYNGIATGHTLGDNVETVLYRIATGSGPSGISGILPRNNLVIHPLLTVTKQQIIDYLSDRGLSYRIDSSNFDNAIPRNSIRNDIIPRFMRINPAFERHVNTLSVIIREENKLLERLTQHAIDGITRARSGDAYVLDYAGFSGLERPIQRRVLIYAFNEVISKTKGPDRRYLPYSVLNSLSSEPVNGNKLLYHNELVTIRKEYDSLIIKKRVVNKRVKGYLYNVNISEGDLFVEEIGRSIRFTITGRPGSFGKNRLYFDYRKLYPPLTLRSRKEGDRITLRNTGTKKLKNLFIDHKVPTDIRTVVPLLECKGTIIGVFCCLYGRNNRVSEEYMVDENTKEVFVCELLNKEAPTGAAE